MPFDLPQRFEHTTTWEYVNRDGSHYGPYRPHQILELLDDGTISPETVLIELETQRSCPFQEVGPFAEYLQFLLKVERETQELAEKRMLWRRFVDHYGVDRAVLVMVGLVVVVIGAVLLNAVISEPESEAPQGAVASPESLAGKSQGAELLRGRDPKGIEESPTAGFGSPDWPTCHCLPSLTKFKGDYTGQSSPDASP